MQNQNKQSVSWFWQPSLRLSWLALAVTILACYAVLVAAVPWWLKVGILTLLVLQAAYQVLRLLRAGLPYKRAGLRLGAQGWQLWNAQTGWQPVQLGVGSMAIPSLVLLRYKHPQHVLYRSVVIAADSLSKDAHRRLRVRLKFSRQCWQAVK